MKWQSWLSKLPTVNTATAPVLGKTNSYTAASAGGALVVTLPSLFTGVVNAGIAAGQVVTVRVNKSRNDASSNPVRVTCNGSDVFESGASSIDLLVPGEKLHLSAEIVDGGPVWVVVDHSFPRDVADSRYIVAGGALGALESIGPASVYRVIPQAQIEPITRAGALRAARNWLRSMQQNGAVGSAALNFVFDSTGTDSSPADGPGPITILAQLLAAAYPNMYILQQAWDQGLCRPAAATVVQAATGGEAKATFIQANSRYLKLYPDGRYIATNADLSVRVRFATTAGRPARGMHLFSQWGSTGTAGEQVVDCILTTTNTLQLRWCMINGTTQMNATSTVPVNLIDNVPIFVRYDLDVDNGASGNTVTFYTSTDRGATWTQLGATVVQAGITTINRPANVTNNLTPYILGGFQEVVSGTSLFIGDIYEVDVRSGPRALNENDASILPQLPRQWQCAASNTEMLTGAPTLWIQQSAWGGHALTDFINSNHNSDGRWNSNDNVNSFGQDNFLMMNPDRGQLATFVSTGHNEMDAGQLSISTKTLNAGLDTFKTKLAARVPSSTLVITTQNPRIAPANGITRHQKQVADIAAWGQRNTATILDTMTMFLDHPQWTSDVTTNPLMLNNGGIHPRTKGHNEVNAPLMFRAIQTGA